MRILAACFVLIAIGSCALRHAVAMEHPPMSPAEQAKEQQLQEAARLQGQPKPDCVWISQRVCVSAAELKRRQAK